MKAYFIGGGVGSLAGAAFLIRDGRMPGDKITIYEGLPLGVWTAPDSQMVPILSAVAGC